MSAAAPWSVKGIDPKAREIAKDLARRSGMTLGEWLNSMIIEDGDDDGYTPLPRRSHASDAFDRRGRSRRLDDAYSGSDETLQRVAASVDAIAARLEAAERRSTIAIQGVDQAVTGLVRRLDGQDQQGAVYGHRIDDIAEELREGHKRLRRFEQETGPRTVETFGKVETSLGALVGRLYDIEERQRSGVNELRQRMDAVEKTAGPGVGADLTAQVGARLDAAQARTTEALKTLERSFGDLDRRIAAAEGRVEPEGVREAARFEKLAETLARQVETNRVEMMRRLDTAEAEGRMDRIERAVLAIGDQVKASEQRSAQGIEAMGREVLRIAQNLNGRVQAVETGGAEQMARLGQTLSETMQRDMGRYAQAVEQRLVSSDDRHALALETLGGEITRISDRLSERITQSERRSAQALEDIGKRLSDSSERIEQRYDRASGELAERMRLSEERTARLLAEARESIEQRVQAPRREAPLESPAPVAGPALEPAMGLVAPDWRAAAFQDPAFDIGEDWSADPLAAPTQPGPFPAMGQAIPAEAVRPQVLVQPTFEPEPRPEFQPETQAAPFGSAQPFSTFGGADVSDALEATEPQSREPQASPGFDAEIEPFADDTEFVDPRVFRAAATAGRAASTRDAIDAARAAMTTPAAAEAPRQGFGLKLKRGGKSKLQERLDKQATRDGSTVRKALLASVTAVTLTAGAYATLRLTDGVGIQLPGLSSTAEAEETAPLALSLTATDATPAGAGEEGAGLYAEAVAAIEAGDPTGIETLERAANLGHAPAQLHLAGLYQTGADGLEADSTESRQWARRAAENQDPRGMHAYGMYLFDGVGGGRNRAEALTWLKKAAERGLVDSQYNVARLYENGDEGIAADAGEALKWYMIAARAGDDQAEAAIARLTPRASATARQAARRAADAFQTEPLV